MFYCFSQNNSFGVFDVDDKVCHEMIIEAESEDEAREIALELGCYWDGVESGLDCPCCGDRWCKYPDELRFPMKYYKGFLQSAEEYAKYVSKEFSWTRPVVRIFYADGTVKTIDGTKEE